LTRFGSIKEETRGGKLLGMQLKKARVGGTGLQKSERIKSATDGAFQWAAPYSGRTKTERDKGARRTAFNKNGLGERRKQNGAVKAHR